MGSGASSEQALAADGTTKKTQQQQGSESHEAFRPESDLVLLPGDSDASSLLFLEKIAAADSLDAGDVVGKLAILREAEDMLPSLSAQNVDHLTVLLYHREGDAYQRSHNFAKAKDAYRKGVQIAELKVAEKSPFLTMILQRYTACILALSSIWFMEENRNQKRRESKLNPSTVVVVASEEPTSGSAAPKAVYRSEEQIATFAEVQRRNSRKFGVNDQRASETAILRCIELLELGLHHHSEHLLWPLFRLVDMYEELHVFSMALRYLRRAIGIVCQCYSYDHAQLPKLLARQERLSRLRDEQLLHLSAIKLQSIVRMRICMQMLSVALQRRVTRHFLIPKCSLSGNGGGPQFLERHIAEDTHRNLAFSYSVDSATPAAAPTAVETTTATTTTGAAARTGESHRRRSVQYGGPVFSTGDQKIVLKQLLAMQEKVDRTEGTTRMLFANYSRDRPFDAQTIDEEVRRRSKLRGWVAQID
jgi:hypothetical protein